MNTFDQAIGTLDLSLFAKIASQSSDHDKRSFLACQLAVRSLRPTYRYLEIGSYLGGSIQPHLLDQQCAHIYSIDKRPTRQPDERGLDFVYVNNSTQRMLDNLRSVAADQLGKVTTLDGETGAIDPAKIGGPVDLCLIDGEHTDRAALRDFEFCLRVLAPNGAILFHDAQITYGGIIQVLKLLKRRATPFHAYALPNVLFAIEIGEFPLHKHPAILERLVDNYESYLYALQDNDHYRRFANRYPFRVVRNLVARLRGSTVSR